jgi:hypothetical protein
MSRISEGGKNGNGSTVTGLRENECSKSAETALEQRSKSQTSLMYLSFSTKDIVEILGKIQQYDWLYHI